ncbi:MAG TPA: glycosyltransferase family 1 protein, partial [Candidatus Acidoferrum sp.]|nr:glycosyltransferase family 1 protein [Candidatus Acidoferrum sp.]
VVHHGTRRLELPEATRENIILCVGAIQRRKNMTRLVEAFEAVDPGWSLILAGSDGYGADEVRARIAASRARARIEAPGYVSPQELAGWYARARVFAFPSLDEGFGMPLLEAFSAGLPVLTSNRSALPEVAGDAALLVDPLDTDSIAEGLRRITRDADLRAELARRGRLRAEGFRWDKAVAETWNVYASLG